LETYSLSIGWTSTIHLEVQFTAQSILSEYIATKVQIKISYVTRYPMNLGRGDATRIAS
jgi:ABC-type dipeptide/oligopeptide/nickel transport system ATPase subunit